MDSYMLDTVAKERQVREVVPFCLRFNVSNKSRPTMLEVYNAVKRLELIISPLSNAERLSAVED